MYLITGICLAMNFILWRWKFNNNRRLDACVDICVTVVLFWFLAILGGVSIAMSGFIASAIISIYLLWKPIKWNPAIRRDTERK
jgi:hypothetical protein